MQKTDWFPPEVKPVRTGVYETKFDHYRGFSYWDGDRWGLQITKASDAELPCMRSVGKQWKTWRGLTSKGGK